MAISNGYATLAEVKSRLDIATTDTDSDAELELVIEGVSRWIDGWFKRQSGGNRGTTQFYAITETRYFTPFYLDKLIVPDLCSITTLKTDDDGDGTYENTWTVTTDYLLWPFNSSPTDSDRPTPYEQIEIAYNGNYSFPVGVPKSVEIVGKWGYQNAGNSETNAPRPIREACILASMKLWKRRDNIFGQGGNVDLGIINVNLDMTNDPAVKALLKAIPSRYM